MNANWKEFLLANNAVFENELDVVFSIPKPDDHKKLYPIPHLGIISISGIDAATFLQGQITCNVKDLSESHSSLGAICNAKGRVITTFILVKKAELFLMILPLELLASVQKRLQMYVLRSKVTLVNSSDDLCLIGLSEELLPADEFLYTVQQENIVLRLNNRSLIIAAVGNAETFWLEQVKQGFLGESSSQWRYLDIVSGIPWLSEATVEEFIPQMLNLDKLGGISFTKGCYTGQEIVARTHYLGKIKREMFVAGCDTLLAPLPNTCIIDASTGTEQNIGKVLSAQSNENGSKMLVVLQVSESNVYNLRLQNDKQDRLSLLS